MRPVSPLGGALLLIACRADPIPEIDRYPAGTPFRTMERTVAGTKLRLIDTGPGGGGVPVIFIHGLGASVYSWRYQLGPTTAAGHRAVAFDNRGFGFSGKPRRGYDNAAYARLVLALMDSLQIPDAVLVGQSMGGAIALEVAARSTQRVRGLVLIGAAGLGVRRPSALQLARWPLVGPVLSGLRGRRFTAKVLRTTYGDPAKVTERDVDQYYAPVADPGYTRAFRAVLREFRFDGLAGRLTVIQTPSLVIWGGRDRWIPPALGKQMASELPRAAFVVIPEAGHAVNEEAPDAVNRLILSFLQEGLPRVPENLARRPNRSGGLGPTALLRYISSTIRLMK